MRNAAKGRGSVRHGAMELTIVVALMSILATACTGPRETTTKSVDTETATESVSTPVETEGSGNDNTEPPPAEPAETGWDWVGLPPEGTVVSTPPQGEVISPVVWRDSFSGLPIPVFRSLEIYADGRVLSCVRCSDKLNVSEKRLSDEGIRLVRSGAIRVSDLYGPWVLHGVPASAWVQADGKPYVPARYAACFWREGRLVTGRVPAPLYLLPASAESLLDRQLHHDGCFEVQTDAARTLDEILTEADLTPGEADGSAAAAWVLREGHDRVDFKLIPLTPDGRLIRR